MKSFAKTRFFRSLQVIGLLCIFIVVVWVCTGRTVAFETDLNSHNGQVLAISVSSDGRYLATGGSDGFVKLWELRSGKQIHVFEDHLRAVYDVEFLNPKKVLSAGQGGTIRLRSISEDAESQILLPNVGSISNVELITADHWLISTVDKVYEWDGHAFRVVVSRRIQSMALSVDRKYVVLGDTDGQIRLYNSESMNEVETIAVPHTDGDHSLPVRVRDMQFSPNNTSLVVLCGDRGSSAIHLVDLQGDKSPIRTIEYTRKGRMQRVSYSPDGQFVIAAGFDLAIWDAKRLREVKRINGPESDFGPKPAYFTAIAFTKEMIPRLAVGCADGKLKLLDFASLVSE